MSTTQPNLFAMNAHGGFEPAQAVESPLAGNTDPVTSFTAADAHKQSGKMHRYRAIALAMVVRLPGRTGYELFRDGTEAERLEINDIHELYRRLADLKNAGKVRHGKARACSVKGSKMVVWELA